MSKIKIEPCVVHCPTKEGGGIGSPPMPLTYEQFMEKYDGNGWTELSTEDKTAVVKSAIRDANEEQKEIAKKKAPKRTWKITTEAKSSDGITVTQDGLKIEYGGSPECLGHLEIDTNAKNCRELMNKLRKGLEMYKKLNK